MTAHIYWLPKRSISSFLICVCQNDDAIRGQNSGDEKITYVKNFDYHPRFCCILSQYLCICAKNEASTTKTHDVYIRNRTTQSNY